MILHGKKIPFPSITQVSFYKILDSLEEQAKSGDTNVANFAKELLKKSARHPELRNGIDPESFDANNELVQRLCRILFPEVLLSNEIKAVTSPFDFNPIYLSTRFKNILNASGKDFELELKNFSEEQLYKFGCIAIMGTYYGYGFQVGSPTLVTIPNEKLGSNRTYKLAMNADLMEVIPTERSIEITEKDYHELLDNYDNMNLWKSKFPTGSWIMRGVNILNLMDVTLDNSISSITSNFLINSSDSSEKIILGIRNLFDLHDLQVGFLMYDNDTFMNVPKEGMQNILLNGKEKLSGNENMCSFSHDHVFNKKQAFIVSDTEVFDSLSNSTMSHSIIEQGIKSYIMAPIINDDEFLGFLELGSKRKYDLNSASMHKLETILPILAMAISRFKREDENRREAIIQQECTTIHSSVKWRFDEEAVKFIEKEEKGENPIFSDIIFSDVYPLYGQLDIKGSSEKRNKAVREDLVKQLKEAGKVISAAFEKTKMPIYEEMSFRINSFRKDLGKELLSGSEPRILGFLEKEIHPVLNQLKKLDPELSTKVNAYENLLNPELHTIYEARKKYDQSVNIINQTLASFLDEKQESAQRMFPHYFERYKTDGVEYNIYVGQSITNRANFAPVFLNNLQLWQLMVTCEMEQKYLQVKNELDSDIEVASLILVYSTPLSVHFRMDEKRFDVEGAYNARYEIVKKRIDKAHIKGTNERITTPGKIAIIYSNEQDALIYGRYISFLEDRGYLIKNSKEELEVEDLQGISGLKALRVSVNFSKSSTEDTFDVNEILEGIQRN